MGAKKIKGARKDVFRDEEVLTSLQKMHTWMERNPFHVAGVAAATVFALALVWGINSYGEAKERKAQSAYAEISAKLSARDRQETTDWEKLIPELEAFIKDHHGTISAADAQLDLCLAYAQTKHYEEVIKTCNEVVKAGDAPPDVKSLARYRLATTYETMGKSDDAINLWNILGREDPEWFGREADWHQARLYCEKHEFTKAVEEYENSIKASGMYPSSTLLQEELASAKLKSITSQNSKSDK